MEILICGLAHILLIGIFRKIFLRCKRMYYRLDSATFNRLFVDSLKN